MKPSRPTTCKICNADLTQLSLHNQYALLCVDHYREYHRELRRKRRESGLCHDCGKRVQITSPVKCRCKKCYERYMEYKINASSRSV
jgi:tRNA(Ile2) C34 agmatinyltransferase TiaS